MSKKNNDFLSDGILDPQLAAEQEEIKSRKLKYSTLATVFTIVFLVALIVANVFIGYLTDRFVLEVDLTEERLFEISEDTKEVIADLNEPITITVLAEETAYRDSTELLGNIYEVLQRYESLANGMITVQYINPNVNPKLVEKYNELGNVQSNDIIVESARRFKRLSPPTLYSYENSTDGTTYYIGLRAEQKLTSALLFVTNEVISKAAYVRGHNETYFMNELDSLLTYANYEVTSVILAREEIPDDVQLLIISSPTVDFSPDEIAKLTAFFKRGGDALVSINPNENKPKPNLSLLFEEWGVKYSNNLILDNTQSLSGIPIHVVPNVALHDGITDNLNLKNYYAVVPGALSIELSQTQSSGVTVASLMDSASTSYGKSMDSLTLGYDRNDQDISGPFSMLVLSEKLETDKNLNQTRCNILFMSAGMITDGILAQTNFLNSQYLAASLSYISEYTDAVIIPDKNFVSARLTILSWQANLVFWLVIIAIPVVFIALGIFVWARRRHL